MNRKDFGKKWVEKEFTEQVIDEDNAKKVEITGVSWVLLSSSPGLAYHHHYMIFFPNPIDGEPIREAPYWGNRCRSVDTAGLKSGLKALEEVVGFIRAFALRGKILPR